MTCFALLLTSAIATAAPPAAGATNSVRALTMNEILRTKSRITPLFSRMGKPQPGDWLQSHPESGQTFKEYRKSDPIRSDGKRSVLYIQPIGTFAEKQLAVVNLTAEFMSDYFGLRSVILDALPLSVIPKSAQRVHPGWGDRQVLTGYVLDRVLKPRLPKDAAALIAFTASDLWPGEGWNFVFGQASLRDRVGVWSIYRNGNADGAPDEFRICLLRTLKTATHETGHMFGMEHCIAYECNLCGSNSREESDGRPLEVCPECAAKVWWATGANPVARYEKLAAFCETNGLKPEGELYRRLIEACR